MKKHYLLFLGIMCALALSAEQMPEGYYNAINGKKDAELKTAISQIICGGQRYKYNAQDGKTHSDDKVDPFTKDTLWKKGSPRYGTWHAFPITDVESDGTIWDMYSNVKRFCPIDGGSAASVDIEHCLPKSWWGGETACYSAFSDLYILYPGDHQANMNKSNYPPGRLVDSAKVNSGLFFMGKDDTWGGLAFDVVDEYKGDFARTYFYTATAYEKVTWVADYKKYINNDSYLGFTDYLIDVLLEWHRIDPVSEKEVTRMDAVSSIQHNRNAFIEYPELVEYIWGNKKGEEVDLSKLMCTTDGTYEFPISAINPLAHEAKQVMKDSFLASWSDTGATEYKLDVFTREESGKNDTLFAIPGLNGAALKDKANAKIISFHNEDGSQITSTSGITDGTYAVIMGNANGDSRYFLLQNMDFSKEGAELVLKCAISRNDKTPQQLRVSADDKEIKTITLSANDSFPRFDIPVGTKQIKITNLKKNRISMHQIFVIRGDYKVTEKSIAGFPVKSYDLEYLVKTPFAKGDKLYYRVYADGLRPTNTVEVIGTGKEPEPQAIEKVEEGKTNVEKVFENGALIIIRNGERYSVMGQRL